MAKQRRPLQDSSSSANRRLPFTLKKPISPPPISRRKARAKLSSSSDGSKIATLRRGMTIVLADDEKENVPPSPKEPGKVESGDSEVVLGSGHVVNAKDAVTSEQHVADAHPVLRRGMTCILSEEDLKSGTVCLLGAQDYWLTTRTTQHTNLSQNLPKKVALHQPNPAKRGLSDGSADSPLIRGSSQHR